MKLREEMPSTASVEEIFAAHTDQAVREEACRRSGATTWSVSIEAADGGGVRIQVDRALPPDVPDMYKKFVGESIDVFFRKPEPRWISQQLFILRKEI